MNPTMMLEDSLWQGVQEWQHHSQSERQIYYEMVGKLVRVPDQGLDEDLHPSGSVPPTLGG